MSKKKKKIKILIAIKLRKHCVCERVHERDEGVCGRVGCVRVGLLTVLKRRRLMGTVNTKIPPRTDLLAIVNICT